MTNNERKLDELTERFVPSMGTADTVAGEILRAVNRIGYRFGNDGDRIGTSQGDDSSEVASCDAAARYLASKCGDAVIKDIRLMWGNEGKTYESTLDKLYGDVVKHINSNPELMKTKNTENLYSYTGSMKDIFPKGYSPSVEEVRMNGMVLEFVERQTPELCAAALKSTTDALQFVKEQDQKMCMAAVQRNPEAIKHVREQTAGMCMMAVRKNPMLLEYAKEQTPKMCKMAVESNGNALQFVKEQTPDLCMAAVRQDGEALRFVREQTPELCMAAVKQDGEALRYVEEQTPELCEAAVEQNGRAIKFVDDKTDELCLAAVQDKPRAIAYVKQTPGLCVEALRNSKNDPEVFDAIRNKDTRMCILANFQCMGRLENKGLTANSSEYELRNEDIYRYTKNAGTKHPEMTAYEIFQFAANCHEKGMSFDEVRESVDEMFESEDFAAGIGGIAPDDGIKK